MNLVHVVQARNSKSATASEDSRSNVGSAFPVGQALVHEVASAKVMNAKGPCQRLRRLWCMDSSVLPVVMTSSMMMQPGMFSGIVEGVSGQSNCTEWRAMRWLRLNRVKD